LRAHIYGVELEIEARPFGGLQIDASAGYQHFKLTQLNQGVNVGQCPPTSRKASLEPRVSGSSP